MAREKSNKTKLPLLTRRKSDLKLPTPSSVKSKNIGKEVFRKSKLSAGKPPKPNSNKQEAISKKMRLSELYNRYSSDTKSRKNINRKNSSLSNSSDTATPETNHSYRSNGPLNHQSKRLQFF